MRTSCFRAQIAISRLVGVGFLQIACAQPDFCGIIIAIQLIRSKEGSLSEILGMKNNLIVAKSLDNGAEMKKLWNCARDKVGDTLPGSSA